MTRIRFIKLEDLINEQGRVCRCWCVYTGPIRHFVLVRTAASLFSASPLKHHAMGKQWCPNLGHIPDSEPDSQFLNSYVLRAKQSNRTSNFNVCIWWTFFFCIQTMYLVDLLVKICATTDSCRNVSLISGYKSLWEMNNWKARHGTHNWNVEQLKSDTCDVTFHVTKISKYQ